MPHSALVYRDIPAEVAPARVTVVAVHGGNGGLDDLVPLGRGLGRDVHLVAPEAARGVYTFRTMVAHTWYGGWKIERPDPASFGDSLAQLERFIYDVGERARAGKPSPPWLLGFDQGAVLALSLAAIAPDLVSGVIAVSGCLPDFSDPDLIVPVPTKLPILLVADRGGDAPPPPAVEATAGRLTQAGASVTTVWVEDARGLGTAVTETARTWLAGQLKTSVGNAR